MDLYLSSALDIGGTLTGGFGKLRPSLPDREYIYGHLSPLYVHLDPETVGEQRPQHQKELLVTDGRGSLGHNIQANIVEPIRTDDLSRRYLIGPLNAGPQRQTVRGKRAMISLHAGAVIPQAFLSAQMHGGYFKCRSRGLG